MVFQSQLKRKSKDAMRKAYVDARGKMKEKPEGKEKGKVVGAASAIVINSEKLVMANMGGYRAVVCRNGEAHQINRARQNQGTPRRLWSRKLIPGSFYFISFETCTFFYVPMLSLHCIVDHFITIEDIRKSRNTFWTHLCLKLLDVCVPKHRTAPKTVVF